MKIINQKSIRTEFELIIVKRDVGSYTHIVVHPGIIMQKVTDIATKEIFASDQDGVWEGGDWDAFKATVGWDFSDFVANAALVDEHSGLSVIGGGVFQRDWGEVVANFCVIAGGGWVCRGLRSGFDGRGRCDVVGTGTLET